ncbi:hypothetical protein D3C85_1912930 [compost metagenome]
MNQAFSAKRAASMITGMSCWRASAAASRMLAMLTGWPPALLQVTVTIRPATLAAPTSSIVAANLGRSKSPFQS